MCRFRRSRRKCLFACCDQIELFGRGRDASAGRFYKIMLNCDKYQITPGTGRGSQIRWRSHGRQRRARQRQDVHAVAAGRTVDRLLVILNRNWVREILIVTYLNSSVENFKTAVRSRLLAMNREPVGYDVRTMHSLSLEIVKLALTGQAATMPAVIDETQSNYFLDTGDGSLDRSVSVCVE